MPLQLTPTTPLRTDAFIELATVYVIINTVNFDRLSRRATFTLGYYLAEPCSLPDSGAAQVNLPTSYALTMTPAQAALVGDPETVLEAYANYELLTLLPGATIETVF